MTLSCPAKSSPLPGSRRVIEPSDSQNPNPEVAVGEFSRLLAENGRIIGAHVRSLVPNASDADDVLQETLATLWEKFDQYRPGSSFSAWACRIAYYKVLQLRDRKHRAPQLFGSEFLELVSEEMVVMADMLDARSEALAGCRDKLPQSDRRLLEQYYRPGSTAAGVADGLQRSVHFVYRAIRRIHGLLFDCINQSLRKGS